MRKIIYLVVLVLIILAGYYSWQRFLPDSFGLKTTGETRTIKVMIKDGEVSHIGGEASVLKDMETEDMGDDLIDAGVTMDNITIKEIMITGDVKHSVPLDEIIGGGPPKDGIPSIDDPKFVSISDATKYLNDLEPGIAVTVGNISRFYPFQILVWHEIVNDSFNGQRVLISYCPLCLSGIVFDPLVKGERVEFGTSGKLWNSNLVMYDRKTDSLWSQILGESIVGEMTGSQLTVLPSDQMRFGQWRKANSSGEVLSKDTGASRIYGYDPYGDYYTTEGTFFNVSNRDDRLSQKDYILGIVINNKAKAYLPSAIKKIGRLEETFAGKDLVIEYDKSLDVVRIFEKQNGGSLKRINPFPNFWFSWVAVHPDTELYK